MASANRTGCAARALISISSLLQNPARGQMPARLKLPMRNVAYVQGCVLRRPPISRMSKVPVA